MIADEVKLQGKKELKAVGNLVMLGSSKSLNRLPIAPAPTRSSASGRSSPYAEGSVSIGMGGVAAAANAAKVAEMKAAERVQHEKHGIGTVVEQLQDGRIK